MNEYDIIKIWALKSKVKNIMTRFSLLLLLLLYIGKVNKINLVILLCKIL